jgi:hypothetical protein
MRVLFRLWLRKTCERAVQAVKEGRLPLKKRQSTEYKSRERKRKTVWANSQS